MSLFWEPAVRIGMGRHRRDPDQPAVVEALKPMPDSDWSSPDGYPELTGTVALDLETRDPMFSRHGPSWPFVLRGRCPNGYVVGVALAWKEGEEVRSGYWPIRHAGGGNLDPDMTMRWLRAQAAKTDVRFVMANSGYDQGWLLTEQIVLSSDPDDIQLMAPLIDENRISYSLDALGKDYVGEKKDEKLLAQAAAAYGLSSPKSDLWKLPAPFVGPYAEQDAALTLKVYSTLNRELDAQGLRRAYEIERDISPLLIDARMRGIRIDEEKASSLLKKYEDREADLSRRVKELCGRTLDPWVNDEIAKELERRGNVLGRTPTGKLSVRKEFLHSVPDPLAKLILEMRRWNKARTTFVEGHIFSHAVDGRIHATFNQLRRDDDEGRQWGTVTHRFSSNSPNLQQLPSPDRDLEVAQDIRGCMLPEEGEEWASVDYKGQEPKLMAYYAEVARLPGGKEVADLFRANPRHDFYAPMVERTGRAKKVMKIITLGLAYGMKDGALCAALGFPTVPKSFKKFEGGVEKTINYVVAGPEGRAVLDEFDNCAPFIRGLFNLAQDRMKQNGFLRCTFDGAKFRLDSRDGEHKALNRLIQGSAARQTKKAMSDLRRAGLGRHFLVTVHDELGFSVPDLSTRNLLSEVMRSAVDLGFQSSVDIEVGPNWGATTAAEEE